MLANISEHWRTSATRETEDHSATRENGRWRGGRAVECGGLENRWSRKAPVGSNPTPSAVKRASPHSPIASSASQYHNAYHNQRRMAPHRPVFDLAKSAGARGDVTGPGPSVCPRVAALGRDERSTRPAPAPRPLATVSMRVARRGWGEWVERFADNGERARSRPTHTPAKVAEWHNPTRPLSEASGPARAQLQRRWTGPTS